MINKDFLAVVYWCAENETLYNGQYSDCRDCMMKNNLYLEFYGREAGGKVLATYKSYPGGGIALVNAICDRNPTSVSYFEPYYWLNIDHYNLYGSGADGRIGMEKFQKGYNNIAVANVLGSVLINSLSPTLPQNLSDDVDGFWREEKRMPGHREYEIHDHLGNVRMVLDDYKTPISTTGSSGSWQFLASIANVNNYMPYGMNIPNETYSASEDYLKGFQGMEREQGLKAGDDYTTHFRGLSTKLPMWKSPDPKRYLFPSMSPYLSMGANPISMIDPMGDKIDPSSQKEWDKRKMDVIRKRDEVERKINQIRAESSNYFEAEQKLNELPERLKKLNKTIAAFPTTEGSPQNYILNHLPSTSIGLTYRQGNNIVMDFSNTDNFVHEYAHFRQFELGKIAFWDPSLLKSSKKKQNSILVDQGDELEAYRAEFAFNGNQVGNSSSSASSFAKINASFLINITDAKGNPIYNKLPAVSITTNTGISFLANAYINADPYNNFFLLLSDELYKKGYDPFKLTIKSMPASYNLLYK